MRERIKDVNRLQHIIEGIDAAVEGVRDITINDIKTNKLLFFGLVKSVEIIGEAAYMLTKEFKAAHPLTSWEDIISMRHVLVHGYYQIEPEILWRTIHKDLLPLKEQIKEYLSEEVKD